MFVLVIQGCWTCPSNKEISSKQSCKTCSEDYCNEEKLVAKVCWEGHDKTCFTPNNATCFVESPKTNGGYF